MTATMSEMKKRKEVIERKRREIHGGKNEE
jgi:hypothetical protein